MRSAEKDWVTCSLEKNGRKTKREEGDVFIEPLGGEKISKGFAEISLRVFERLFS
jgi:hypothetical protein